VNLTPEQQWTILMLFMAKATEDSIALVSGVRPPWWVSVGAVIFPYPPTDSH